MEDFSLIERFNCVQERLRRNRKNLNDELRMEYTANANIFVMRETWMRTVKGLMDAALDNDILHEQLPLNATMCDMANMHATRLKLTAQVRYMYERIICASMRIITE
eukprot:GHVU01037418.1.p2 GENE.GHVU01037418.1~~GHVU01037418.1.p2  ORF type:complete len:107 (+),score=10.68 GHVU01037418.1:833-1153(+)